MLQKTLATLVLAALAVPAWAAPRLKTPEPHTPHDWISALVNAPCSERPWIKMQSRLEDVKNGAESVRPYTNLLVVGQSMVMDLRERASRLGLKDYPTMFDHGAVPEDIEAAIIGTLYHWKWLEYCKDETGSKQPFNWFWIGGGK